MTPLPDRATDLGLLLLVTATVTAGLLALAVALLARGPVPLALLALVQIPTMAWVLGTAGLAFVLGVPVVRVSFGVGPVLLERPLGRTTYCLRALPNGTNVSFEEENTEPGSTYRELPRATRFGLAVAGPLSIFALALVLSGVEAMPTALALPGQLVRGALSPIAVGAPLWQAAFDATAARGLDLLGPIAAKLAAAQLLVVSTLVQIAGPLLERVGVDLHERIGAITGLGLLVLLPVLGSWLVALVVCLAG